MRGENSELLSPVLQFGGEMAATERDRPPAEEGATVGGDTASFPGQKCALERTGVPSVWTLGWIPRKLGEIFSLQNTFENA